MSESIISVPAIFVQPERAAELASPPVSNRPPGSSPFGPHILVPVTLVHPDAVAASLTHGEAAAFGIGLGALRENTLKTLIAVAQRLLLIAVALWLFILALQSIKSGASGLQPLSTQLGGGGIAGYLGLGWFGAYVVMSGSPVAAIALSLFAAGTTTDLETFAMINGSRLGASFIVLVVGFVSYLRGRRSRSGLYVGVVALLTAVTLWAPVVPLGLFILRHGWFDGVQIESPGALTSFVNYTADPIVKELNAHLPRLLVFAAGVGCLLGSFSLFDRALPNLDRRSPRLSAWMQRMQQRYAMFAIGTLVTLVTMSVALSVTILVPLTVKGYVHRDRIIPYVMGANIATWIDTLFASLLLGEPRAFTLVFTEMVTGAAISMLILNFAYRPYTRCILWVARRAVRRKAAMACFLACFSAAPLSLLYLF